MTGSPLCSGLFGKTRQAVLTLLYGQADRSLYTKQILDAVNSGRGTVERELKHLTDSGFLRRTVQGRQVYYQADPNCPVYADLKNLVAAIAAQETAVSHTVTEGNTRAGDSRVRGRVPIPKDKLAGFCRRHHIRRLSLFGSVLRDDFRPDSDIDVLVEFEPCAVVGFFKLYDMEQELSVMLGGRKVDISTPGGLSKYFRDEVLAEAEVQYVQT